jgi:hypothetical protein
MKLQRSRSTFEALEGRQLLSGTPWGQQAKLIGQDLVAQQFPQLTGAGETVVMIDSGVDYNHPSLGGGWGKKVIAGWDFQSNDSNPMSDTYAHGTGTAGMVAANPYDYKGYHYQGIAPGVKLISLRESNSNQVAAALKWVIANKSKYNIVAVNFTDFGGFNKDAGLSIKASIGTLDSMNVYVSRPSGNSGTTSGVANYYDEAVVGSVNKSDGISSFTNRGAGLDFLAPAEKITLPYYDVGSKKHIYVDVADGTSWSAPQIAGAAALLRQINPRFTNAQITSILTSSAVQKYDSASKRSYPRLNLYGAVKLAYQQAGKSVPSTPTTPTPPPPPPPTTTKPTTPSAPAGVVTTARTTIGASAVIQAEDFDSGAEGSAYHDTDSANRGGNNYRPGTGVDINTISADQSSTRSVGYTRAGEWLKYSVNVQTAGTYSIAVRMASVGAGGQFHVEVDGKNVTGTMNVVDTKSWKSYADIVKTGVSLSAGNHTVRVIFDRNAANGYVADFNLIRFTRTSSTSTTTPTTTTTKPATTTTTTFVPPKTTPFKGFNLAPGVGTVIQAEDFDAGDDNAAYKDLTVGNQGGQYRNGWMDIEKSSDSNGGYDVTNLQAGEWMNYTVNVTKAGTFNLDTRVASATGGGSFHLEIDGKNVTGTMVFTNTGGLQKWTTVRKSGIAIAAGKHSVRLVIDSTGGKPYAGNINWMKFS